MNVNFKLEIKNAIIGEKAVDHLVLSWLEELDQEGLAERFRAWLKDPEFIEKRFPDLKQASYCNLTIDPS